MNKLISIKILHTIIWFVIGSAIIYMLYSAIIDDLNLFTWIGVGLSVGESIVILINKWTCPLTPLAAKYTKNREPNFDIYLPRWLAKYNKNIFIPIMLIGWLLVLFRIFQ